MPIKVDDETLKSKELTGKPDGNVVLQNGITRVLTGRRKLYTDVTNITSSNIVGVLEDVMSDHLVNSNEIDYLYKYYKGYQPILNRIKEIRPEICNMIVENRANEIVSFKEGYLMGEPIQYVSRSEEEAIINAVNILNEYIFAEDKNSKDRELAEWFFISGTAFRMVLPDEVGMEDESPFEIYTLDPRYTFVIYSSKLGNKPLLGVTYYINKKGDITYYAYSDSQYFEIKGGKVIKTDNHILSEIPIIEYPANLSRLGAFEIVLPLLDALNNVDSNRLDGVEQFVQSLLKFVNVDITSEQLTELYTSGAIKIRSDNGMPADVQYIVSELNQSQTQTLKDDIYQTILTICGMPNRNGGTSTSDTGSAVIMRDGWSAAEARAKDSELIFKKSEKVFLKIVTEIMRIKSKNALDLKLSNIEIRFTRRNYENIVQKANVLVQMLNCDKVHPKLAFEQSGMFIDSNLAYIESQKYYEENKEKQESEQGALNNAEKVETTDE